MVNKYILDAKEQNINILPPNINKSQMNFSTNGDFILFGLSAISGVGENLAKDIIDKRIQLGKFKNLNHLLENVSLNKSQVIKLIKSGAIPSKNKRKTIISYLKSFYEPTSYKDVSTYGTKIEMLLNWDIDVDSYKITNSNKIDKDKVLELYNAKRYEKWKEKERLRMEKYIKKNSEKYLMNEDFWEFEALEIFLSENPFEKSYNIINGNFEEIDNEEMCTIVGIISKVQKKKDKNKKQFAFANIYSAFGLVEATIWHTQLKENIDLIKKGERVAILGKKVSDGNIIVEKIKPYDTWLIDIASIRGL